MTPKDAADKIRPDFHLEQMPAEDRHHVKFIEDVATELGVEHTPFNLHQVGEALDHAGIEPDSNEYPKMLYSRTHHSDIAIAPSYYDKRHDYVHCHVASAQEAAKLGSDWKENPADLPERGETPIHAPMKASEPGPAKELVPSETAGMADKSGA